MQVTPSGLYYKITKTTAGAVPQKGDQVSVHYAGKLVDGTEFDSSFKRNQPIDIAIGIGQVIKGWDEGILLLKEGETPILRYKNLDSAKEELLNTLSEYLIFFREHPKSQNFHPRFGPLNKEMMELFHRKHFTHHFEQFNLI